MDSPAQLRTSRPCPGRSTTANLLTGHRLTRLAGSYLGLWLLIGPTVVSRALNEDQVRFISGSLKLKLLELTALGRTPTADTWTLPEMHRVLTCCSATRWL